MVKSISGNRSSNSTNPEEISVEELTNWMKPRLEPSLWKKYIWPKQYEKEGAQYNAQYEALLGTDQEDKENKRGISKEQFIDGVTREIRDGNQEVNHYDECWIISYKLTLVIVLIDNYSQIYCYIQAVVSLKNICRRLEHAEVYKVWPPKLFMVFVTIAQIFVFAFHKVYYSKFYGKC